MIILNFIGFAVGLLFLIKGADFLVESASFIAARLRVPAIIIGLVIVSFGTSLPELLISVLSATQGDTQLAVGNIIGSNITNILLILPAAALFTPITVTSNTLWKEIPLSLLSVVALLFLGAQRVIDAGMFADGWSNASLGGTLGLSAGIIMLLFFTIFIFYSVSAARNEQSSDVAKEVSSDVSKLEQSWWKQIGFGILGLIGLGVGSQLSVDNAITIASFFGVASSVIGLTVVSLGTSLPELVTSIVAGSKAESELVLGNVVGSNIMNILLVLALTAIVSPIALAHQNIIDIIALIGVTITLLFIIYVLGKKNTISKLEAWILLAMYISYLVWVVAR